MGEQIRGWIGHERESSFERPAAYYFGAPLVIVAPGGWNSETLADSQFYPVTTPEDAHEAVDHMVNLGADMIKIYLVPGDLDHPLPMLDLELVQAIVEEAHKHGLMVRAHANRPSSLDIVLQAGVDVIEHLPGKNITEEEYKSIIESPNPISLVFDVIAPEFDNLFCHLVEQKVVMVPTLETAVGEIYGATDLTHEQQIRIDLWVEKARRFHNMGGTIALGTDYGIPGVELGMPIKEMRLLVEAGLTPMEVIESGTRHAAYVCEQDDELGTLEPGKLADVIVVNGNPLTDIQDMSNITLVIKGGEIAYTSE